MAPSRHGGRPGNNWTRTRRRKLVRLCSFTCLSIEDIRKVLQEDGFNPCIRDYKKQLKSLFPSDYAGEWRRYRPHNDVNARSRFGPLKSCKDSRVAKDQRLRLRSRLLRTRRWSRSVTSSGTSDLFALQCPWRNPLGNYKDSSTDVEPYVCPKALQKTSSSDPWKSGVPDLLAYDDSALHATSSVISMQTTKHFNYSLPLSRKGCDKPGSFSSHSPLVSTVAETSHARPSPSLLPSDVIDNFSGHSLDTGQLRDSTMLIKAKSSKSLSTLSVQSLQRRLTGKVGSESIEHIHSVLRYSSSNSWRSSVKSYASSWKSRGSSLLNRESLKDSIEEIVDSNLSSSEQRSWDELVDETQLAPYAQPRPVRQQISLSSRPCCSFMESADLLDPQFLCHVCGFSNAHGQGRQCVNILGRGFASIIFPRLVNNTDRFGNTPLHFAASSPVITTAALKSIITSGVNIKARNTSGENFLHVLNVPALGDITEYIELLRFLENHEFRYLDRDYNGCTVAHKFCEGVKLWETKMLHLEEIFLRLRVDFSEVDNLGNDYGLSDLALNWISRALESGVETMDYVSSLLARHSNPMYSEVDYSTVKDWPAVVWDKSFVKWVDVNGDTPLTATVKYWPEGQDERPLLKMVRSLAEQGCEVNARDREGCTALAIAARRGLRPAVSSLLALRASVNTRSCRDISTLSLATMSLRLAQLAGNDRLYGMIVSCIGLITDWGAKMDPTVYDEFVAAEPRTLPATQVSLSPFPPRTQRPTRTYRRNA